MPVKEHIWTPDLLVAPHDSAGKANRVRSMFNAIAPRYRLVNSIFSGGRDAAWRRKAVDLAAVCHDDDVLDIACGTGEFAEVFARAGARRVIGCDFAHQMVVRASRRHGKVTAWCEADGLQLPYADGRFSITSCAFGVRNFQTLETGFQEMFRVLRPGGRAVILEFSRPTNRIARALYELYSTRIMPVFATVVSGDRTGAYRYLPRSVVSFPNVSQVCEKLRLAGFGTVTAHPLTLGVVQVYIAERNAS